MNSRLRDYVIGLGDLNFGWIPLYVVTWALLAVCGWLRSLAVALVLLIVTWIAGWDLPIDTLALVIGFAPLAISLATLVLPLGGWWFQQQEGGRPPSERERAVFESAFELLRGADPNLRPPRRWFVTDDPEPNACAYADTLMVTRGLLESPSFPAVLAHELGHLNSSDARVSAAIVRMTTPPRKPGRLPVPLDRLPGQRADRDGHHAQALGDVLAPSGEGCRRLRGQARPGAGACRLPRHLRPRRRPAHPVQGLRRYLPPLDRAPHRRSRCALRATANSGARTRQGRPCGAALRAGAGAPLLTEPRPCVESGNYVGRADEPNDLERSPRCAA